jgi:hypothetical protein
MKLFGIINVGFDITDQLLIRFSAFSRYWRKKWEYNETIDFKKVYFACGSVPVWNLVSDKGGNKD